MTISCYFCITSGGPCISERTKHYSFDAKKALKKDCSLEFDLKKVKEKLVVEKAAHKASDEAIAKSKLEADAAQEKLHKALQDLAELRKVATIPMYKQVFDCGYVNFL